MSYRLTVTVTRSDTRKGNVLVDKTCNDITSAYRALWGFLESLPIEEAWGTGIARTAHDFNIVSDVTHEIAVCRIEAVTGDIGGKA